MPIPSRSDWVFDETRNDILINDKKRLISLYIKRLFNFINPMFEYDNLPDTIPREYLELLIQQNGYVTIAKVNDKLYALRGELGGEYNEYYLPTISVCANPYLKLSKTYKIDEDCVIIRNDVLYEGLYDYVRKYAELLSECDITIKYGLYNARIPFVASAEDDNTKESFDEFYKKIVDGADFGIPVQTPLMNALKVEKTENTQSHIKDIMEIKQYYLASFYNELGLNANYNMKREAINENESAMNDDILIPSIDTMLKCREEDVEKVNNMFGTNIKVKLSSVWDLKKEVVEEKIDLIDEEENIEEGGEVVNEENITEDTTN